MRRARSLSGESKAAEPYSPAQKQDKVMRIRRILVKEEVCMGCGLCEVYCLVQHSRSKDIIKAYKKENPRPTSRVRLEKAEPVSFAIQCRNCDDPPCVVSCLSGAMHVDNKTGQVVHDPDKCIGCWTCIMVCPYGAVMKDASGSKVVAKCDLCPGLEVPACVANCPNEALMYEEVHA
jgi:carbon-monoxide dehydrogenase iron sulfur subunit